MAYKKCPRCELNYIQDTESYCRICLIEMGKLDAPKDFEEDLDICPECGENVIKQGEIMCHQCAQLMEQQKSEEKETMDDFVEPEDAEPEIEEEDMFVSMEEMEYNEEQEEETEETV